MSPLSCSYIVWKGILGRKHILSWSCSHDILTDMLIWKYILRGSGSRDFWKRYVGLKVSCLDPVQVRCEQVGLFASVLFGLGSRNIFDEFCWGPLHRSNEHVCQVESVFFHGVIYMCEQVCQVKSVLSGCCSHHVWTGVLGWKFCLGAVHMMCEQVC